MRTFLLLLALLIGLGPAAQAVTGPSEDPLSPVPEDVTAWFAEKAPATVRSHGAEEFPKASAEELAAMSVGTPRKTGALARGTAPAAAIQPSARWIAPIMSGDTPVGAVSVNITDGVASDEIVRGDTRLGAATAREDKGGIFVWDSQLSAWFALREASVEPADSAGAKIILGAIPLTDFLAQRERILSSSTPIPDPPQDRPAAATNEGHNLPVTIALVLLVIGVLIASLVWLRSEQVQSPAHEEMQDDDLDRVTRKGMIGTREAKMRFRDLGNKVKIYKSPNKKGKESSGLSDD